MNPKPLTNAPKINSTNTPKTFNSTYASKTWTSNNAHKLIILLNLKNFNTMIWFGTILQTCLDLFWIDTKWHDLTTWQNTLQTCLDLSQIDTTGIHDEIL